MADLLLNNIYILILLPFWLFMIIMLGRFFSVYVNKSVINCLTLLASAFGAFFSAAALFKMPVGSLYETSFQFIKINDFSICCGVYVDRIALIFSLVLFMTAFCVQLFAAHYMKDDKKYYRFFALLNLFSFSMTGLFFSPNLFQTYVFWEVAGICSYLLIGFDYFNSKTSLASKKVFIINRFGDVALITAILTCSYYIFSYTSDKSLVTLPFTDIGIISTFVRAFTSDTVFGIICILFVTAALVKSAQTPFYTWLQDAMEAKLPVSALLHSSTLVAAGLYLTVRLFPFFTTETYLPKVIGICGLITAVICSVFACSQKNTKKTLAYSTSAQFGIMFFALGILKIKAAIILFAAHALIKSMLFLTLPKEDEKWSYTSFVLFLTGGLSLSGLIFAGMASKEILVLGINNPCMFLISAVSFISAFYIIRIALITADKNGLEKVKPAFAEIVPSLLLLLFNILFYVYLRKTAEYKIAEPFWFALIAWVCVYTLYVKNELRKDTVLYPLTSNGFYLDKFYTKFCVKLYNKFTSFCGFVDREILGNYKPVIFTAAAGVKIADFAEKYIFNGIIRAVTNFTKYFALTGRKAQSGNIQRYNLYGFIIITIILTCLIMAYTAIINYMGG